jgi:hypothetical protein
VNLTSVLERHFEIRRYQEDCIVDSYWKGILHISPDIRQRGVGEAVDKTDNLQAAVDRVVEIAAHQGQSAGLIPCGTKPALIRCRRHGFMGRCESVQSKKLEKAGIRGESYSKIDLTRELASTVVTR